MALCSQANSQVRLTFVFWQIATPYWSKRHAVRVYHLFASGVSPQQSAMASKLSGCGIYTLHVKCFPQQLRDMRHNSGWFDIEPSTIIHPLIYHSTLNSGKFALWL